MVDKDLASALKLPDDCEDEVSCLVFLRELLLICLKDISCAIVALLTSAVNDAEPRSSFSEIYRLITNFCATSYLVCIPNTCESSILHAHRIP